MARCNQCNRFLFIKRDSGLCVDCEKANADREKRLEKAQQEYTEGVKLYKSKDPSIKLKSIPLFISAAEAGLAIAQTQIGNMYMEGDVVTKDEKEAIRWTEKAVEQQYPMAESNLGVYYLNGFGVPKNTTKAIELLERAAGQDDDFSMNLLGKIYSKGIGIEQDIELGRKYYLKGITRGNADAFFAILEDDHKDYVGRKKCLPVVKEEFNAVFPYMKDNCPVKDVEGIPQDYFNQVASVKRAEKYVWASRMYMLTTFSKGYISSNIAASWLKTLAASGAVMDALAIGEYVLSRPNVERRIPVGWSMLESNTVFLRRAVDNKSWQELADRCTELAGFGFAPPVKVEDLDIWL